MRAAAQERKRWGLRQVQPQSDSTESSGVNCTTAFVPPGGKVLGLRPPIIDISHDISQSLVLGHPSLLDEVLLPNYLQASGLLPGKAETASVGYTYEV